MTSVCKDAKYRQVYWGMSPNMTSKNPVTYVRTKSGGYHIDGLLSKRLAIVLAMLGQTDISVLTKHQAFSSPQSLARPLDFSLPFAFFPSFLRECLILWISLSLLAVWGFLHLWASPWAGFHFVIWIRMSGHWYPARSFAATITTMREDIK
jgi:hypothetical protein